MFDKKLFDREETKEKLFNMSSFVFLLFIFVGILAIISAILCLTNGG